MATLVLTAVGSAIAGPIGGLVGSFLGASLDRAVFGGGKKSGARVSDLAVQSSAYGEPIPRLYGRIRVAGNLIWSPGIKESASSGGGKRRSGTSYSYSASFAVALAARRVTDVARIWADGKLLRNAEGAWIYPAVMRLHTGSENQAADPLIIATEGAARAPAYRGLAYVVFEDLPLADYGNRIPNLTFEVVADAVNPDVGMIATDLAVAANVAPVVATGIFPDVRGFAAAHAGSLRSQFEPLAALADLSFVDGVGGLTLHAGAGATMVHIHDRDLGAMQSADAGAVRRSEVRGAADTLPDSLAIGFFDPARDYQIGLQRAIRRAPAMHVEQRDLAVVLSAAEAKAVAETLISNAVAARSAIELRVPWRHAAVAVGDTLRIGAELAPWRVRSRMVEAMLVRISAERVPAAPRGLTAAAAAADPGRSLIAGDQPNGPTLLHVLDLPPLPGQVPVAPRLWLAAAGTGSAWRRAEIEVSLDGGNSYQGVTTVSGAAVLGTTLGSIGGGAHDRWDRIGTVDIELAHDAMWLESRTEADVLAGANLALVGDEIIQFTTAAALAPSRFQLSGLLRGRRGTESAIAGHGSGERFVMLGAEALVPFDAPIEALGRTLRFRAGAPGGETFVAEIGLAGQALRPLSPAHLRLVDDPEGAVSASWTRRSRGGFAWIDGVDAPLAEEREAYAIDVRHAGVVVRRSVAETPQWTYQAADRVADGTAGSVRIAIEVAQLSSVIGRGASACAEIDLLPV